MQKYQDIQINTEQKEDEVENPEDEEVVANEE